jgi:hypothetical protein
MNAQRLAPLVAAVLVLFAFRPAASSEVSPHCTIRPPKGTEPAALPSLAKVSRAEALEAAIDSLKTSAAVTAVDSSLEVEDQCLVWSFDLKVTGAKGFEEVQVDAGTGRVLKHEHESARHEKKEKAAEAN